MDTSSIILTTMRHIMKFYDQCLECVRQNHGLSRLEIIIISFLHNNPDHDTVAEIAYMRMLSKGNVSRAADSLIRRGLLDRIPDQTDRRWVHLKLTPEAAPIVSQIAQARLDFQQLAFEGFTSEEMTHFESLNHRLTDNICRNFERSSCSHVKQ